MGAINAFETYGLLSVFDATKPNENVIRRQCDNLENVEFDVSVYFDCTLPAAGLGLFIGRGIRLEGNSNRSLQWDNDVPNSLALARPLTAGSFVATRRFGIGANGFSVFHDMTVNTLNVVNIRVSYTPLPTFDENVKTILQNVLTGRAK
jgi:hypothetical protein